MFFLRMPWQGNANILIDRFDVRAHLDYIPDVQNEDASYSEEARDSRPLNYERYRILVQNGFLKGKLNGKWSTVSYLIILFLK